MGNGICGKIGKVVCVKTGGNGYNMLAKWEIATVSKILINFHFVNNTNKTWIIRKEIGIFLKFPHSYDLYYIVRTLNGKVHIFHTRVHNKTACH
jgi:hypothetical protein